MAAADARLPSCQHRIAIQREVVGFGDANVEDPAGMALRLPSKTTMRLDPVRPVKRASFVLLGPSQRISTSWPTSASCIGSTLNIAAEGFPLDLASFAEVGTLIDVKKPRWVFLR